MWVKFVVGSLLAPRGFSLGTPVFPSLQKPTLPNSNSCQIQIYFDNDNSWLLYLNQLKPTSDFIEISAGFGCEFPYSRVKS